MDFNTPGYEDLELSTQLIIKEAMQRGIEVELLDRGDNFLRLTKGDRVEYIKQATKTSADSYIVPLIMENKVVTKKVLEEQGIAVPAGGSYQKLDEALAGEPLFNGKKIVVKPNSTNFGIGITILQADREEESFTEAVKEAFKHDSTILIEQFVEGPEYRFLIIGDEVTAVLERVPANVLGDGTETVAELVEQKNRNPLRGTGYTRPLEKIRLGEVEREFLRAQGRSFDYIPAKEERLYLRKNSNISTGGDSIDHTDTTAEVYKEIALKATKAVGAKICGADIVIRDITQEPREGDFAVIELNFNPALHIHAFPFQGKNRKGEVKVLDLLGF